MVERLIAHIQIARIDHWFKNVFMVPGIAVAMYLDASTLGGHVLLPIVVSFLAAGLVASSNYVINEILDAEFDRMHPVKKNRPIPSGEINIRWAYIEWVVLAVLGLAIAHQLGKPFFISALTLWLMGCLYNIPPVRTKDKPYLDVVSESVNNPLRLLLGWYATGTALIPPISLVIAYWMIGAFFMALKRYAEFRRIGDKTVAGDYRASFKHYTAERLLVSVIYYIAIFGFFFGIFLIRYRIEFILATPFVAGFVAWYMQLAFLEDSPVQYPERLYRQPGFFAYASLCGVVFLLLLMIDIPFLEKVFSMTSGL